eukprot:3686296-Pleurochrysis_carterae.AAC.1
MALRKTACPACSARFSRIGIANQTTMYKKETQAIGRLLEKAMVARYGPEEAADNFAAFDTICDATQVRVRMAAASLWTGPSL